MVEKLIRYYEFIVIRRPIISLIVVLILSALLGTQANNFKLDASSDSLVLENDKDLQYFREVGARYEAQDFLFLTYKPKAAILSDESLAILNSIKNDLLQLERVDDVVSLLDVPLIDSPRITFSDLDRGTRNLQSPEVDKELARKEFLSSPLYKDLLMNAKGDITALQVNLKRDEKYYTLLNKRNDLRQRRRIGELTTEESADLKQSEQDVKDYTALMFSQQKQDIASVRAIMDKYRDKAELFLGGVTMVTSDMIDYIRSDLVVFGLVILLFLIATLTIIFRQARWIFLPMLCCGLSGFVMLGFLGWVDWPVTVISSNFISLLLIITMSLTMHLIVRYRELHGLNPDWPQDQLVMESVKQMFMPCYYTAITTIAAFASLVVSGIRPVIDFGYMMIVGICFAFILSFVLFPAITVLFKPGKPVIKQDFTSVITLGIAHFTERFSKTILWGAVAVFIISIVGILNLKVENRFIDYFKSSTEIHQGMQVIDNELGGTMPLDIMITADKEFYKFLEQQKEPVLSEEEVMFGVDETEESEELPTTESQAAPSYWFNDRMLKRLEDVHHYIDELPETGKVLSLATSMKMIEMINNDKPLDNLELAILRKKLPDDLKAALIDPYVSEDGNEARISIRVIESYPDLRRDELIKRIVNTVASEFGFAAENVRATNMLVLYNNMLQSLFKSQILTLGVVMFCIMIMFVILFRSVFLAVIAIIPNILSAFLILGIMGIIGIPLDLMSITIAAITIGIAVDNAIHYIHRFRVEFPKDHNYVASVRRCHGSIGKAMYFTSLTIIMGFSILALSNFIPTIYFGVLTALAMLIAFVANLVVLPRLMVLFKPLGKEANT